MPSRKTIAIVLSLLLVATVVVLVGFPGESPKHQGRKLQVQHPEQVNKIILADTYDSTMLLKSGDHWVTSGGDAVNPAAVENLLYAAGRLQINSIFSEGKRAEAGDSRRVQFFRGEKLLLGYEVFTYRGQFLVRPERNDRAYSVTLPGFAGLDLNRVFSSATNHYLEHLLIDLLPSEIRHIEVEKRDAGHFRFSMENNGEIRCSLPGTDSTVPSGLLDDISVRLLFSYFTSIRYEEKADVAPEILVQEHGGYRWLGRLYVESRRGEKHTLNVYSMPGPGSTGNHMFRALVIHNDAPDALVINYLYLDVLMRDLSGYFAGGG